MIAFPFRCCEWRQIEPQAAVENRTMGQTIKGNWKQMTGKLKAKWGKLTDYGWTTIAGKGDELLGKLQEKYGYQKDQAEKEVDDFIRTLDQP